MSSIELANVGFKKYGTGVLVSRLARIYNPNNIILGNNVRIDDYSILSAAPNGGPLFTVGNYVHFAAGCYIYGSGGFSVDNFCGFSGGVKVYTETDDYNGDYITSPLLKYPYRKLITNNLSVKNYVVIGAGSVILPSAKTIEEGVAIGANSLVYHPCNAWTIYAGSPVKPIKKRSQGLVALASELM